MKLKSCVFFLSTIIFFAYGCSNKIGTQLMTEISDSETDSVIIKPTMAVFIFNIDTRNSWHWYQNDTNANKLEYGWWTVFDFNNNQYTCGYRLFKHPSAEPTNGSFKQLVQAGQIDLSSRETISQKPTSDGRTKVQIVGRRNDDAKVESIVKSNKLIILLREQQIIEEFRSERPDSLLFYNQIAGNEIDRHKVGVTYTSN